MKNFLNKVLCFDSGFVTICLLIKHLHTVNGILIPLKLIGNGGWNGIYQSDCALG